MVTADRPAAIDPADGPGSTARADGPFSDAEEARGTSVAPSLAAERLDYRAGTLDDALLTAAGGDGAVDPLPLLRRWVDDAFARRDTHSDIPEPSAVVLSTVELSGPAGLAAATPRPRSRTVLLKGFDETGFVVYTNKDSDKGRQLADVPWASLLLAWLPLQRQVRIDGRVEHVPDAEADAYWASRPRASQLGSAASEQSRPIASRAALEEQLARITAEHEGAEVPRPPHWGGYRIVPDRIEFWQGRPGRLHDRIVFARPGDDEPWTAQRLQP